MFRSLKSFILGGVLLGSIAIFFAVYLFSFILFENLIESKARETSRALSLQTFSTMFQIMRKGWTRSELEDFLSGIRSAYQNTSMELEIYRGPVVEARFGTIEQKKPDDLVMSTFRSGREQNRTIGGNIRYVYPLRARDECLLCHINALKGDVLGAIEVRQDVGPALASARRSYILFLLLFSPVPIIIAIAMAMILTRRLQSPIDRIRNMVGGVNSVKDMRELNFVEIDLKFSELNGIMHSVAELVQKLRNIAIDKDTLEFEIKLIEKLIIASEVVKDWKEYVKHLLREIHSVIDSSLLFTLFRIGDGEFELEIFWRGKPTESMKTDVEWIVSDGLHGRDPFPEWGTFLVIHNIGDESIELPNLTRRQLQNRLGQKILTSPMIGGVIGIGLESSMVIDSSRQMIVESILATLLNAVGSIRAVYKYTKDLEYFATRDPLTNLFNQRVFWDLLEYETGRADRHGYTFALLMIDLDNFKTINDRYGHSFGDLFLKEFSQAVRDSTRKEDIIARYGGDEFTIILPESDENQAFLIASRIQAAMESISLDTPDGNRVKGTMSIGITIYPEHGSTARDLFLVADNMMYRAKKEGKNTLVFPSEEDVADVFKKIGEKSMLILNAIEERRIIPYFQPIVDVQTGRVVIHELLMRIGINGSVTTASDFIDVAENMGVVHKLDYILMEKAFEQTHSLKYQGKIFINLSPRALIISEFISKVKRLAQEYRIAPSDIVFEITERETVRSMSLLEKFVRDLKTEGFKFAVDDFGSGFSSFSYLKRFPIDYVKIDGEFIRNMVLDSRDRAMVKSVTTLARELGIKTVAEFVESGEILSAVAAAGIDYAQGFHLGKPSRNLIM